MPRPARIATIAALVGSAYLVSALLGFRAAFVAEQVTTVWAPTGIAQAALLLWGIRLWPAVWIAAFTANALTDASPWVAAGIATGNTLEAVVAAWALFSLRGFDPALRRTRDAGAFIVIAAVASPVISASVGVTSLCMAGLQPWTRYPELWREWWSGDALGALLIAPAILTIVRREHERTWRRTAEVLVLVAATVITTQAVSGRFLFEAIGDPPLVFVIFPFVIVAAVRLGQPATALVTLSAAAVIVFNTLAGYRPFSASTVRDNLLLVHVFMGVLGGSGLLLSAATTERRVLERRRAAAYMAGSAIAGSSSLAQAAPRVLRAVCTNLNWTAGALWLRDAATDRLRCVAAWPDDGTASTFLAVTRDTTFAIGSGLPGRVWATAAPAWIEDVTDDANFPRAPAARASGLHGAFAFPIVRHSEFLGVVEFFSEAVASVDPDLLATMSGIGNQISDFLTRTKVEAAVTEEQTRSRAILETALDAIISMDQEGRVTEFNRAAETMFGYSRDEAIGRDLAALIIPGGLREGHRAGLKTYLSTGKGPFIDSRVETTAVRADGHQFPVEVSITRVPTTPPLFTGFVRDVTSRVNAERERTALLEAELAARREAEAANRAKDEFLATLSHELRTPLNAIVGWTRMLLDGTLDEDSHQRALQIIDRNAHLQAQLVTDILDVSRIITGKMALDIRPVDLSTIVSAALDTVRPSADAKRIRIASTIDPSARFTSGDPQRLQQVIWNLLSNAIKFTPEDGFVAVDLDARGEKLSLTVADSGAGIPPHFIPHVFDRFRQADSSSTREHGGLGLGLAIVRHIVEAHGGSVRAESEGPGKGARFIVELPRTSTEADAGMAAAGGGAAATASRSLQGCRVLVVDDQRDARELLTVKLAASGAEVRTAVSVEDALKVVRERWPNVLLADIGLPGRDGYSLIREIRQMERDGLPRLRAAAVTAYALAEDRDRALAAGFDAYVAKPIQPRAIIDTVLSLWTRSLP
jgi:PAS domain S-box-containing protein